MRLAVVLLLALVLSGCVGNTPAEHRAAAAGMEQATQDAVGLLSVERQYTEQARAADATATQAAATLMVASARATMEMAAAERAANAQALDNLRATATLSAQRTEIAAEPTRAAATATRQAVETYQAETIEFGISLAGALVLIAVTGVVVWILIEIGQAIAISIRAWAERRKVEAAKAAYLETSEGLKYLGTGIVRPASVVVPGAISDPPQAEPHASEVAHAPAAQVRPSPTIGRLEMFVIRAIRYAPDGQRADYIPRHDVMGMSGDKWTAEMEHLEALGMIPKRQQGKRSTLYGKETLGQLLIRVQDYERKLPSPTGGDAKNRA